MRRALRRRLAEIRYHSAPRKRSRWGRMLDVASVVTLVVAIVTVIVLDVATTRRADLAVQRTTMVAIDAFDLDGAIEAVLWPDPDGGFVPNAVADVTVRLVEVRGGWPLTTSSGGRALRVDYDTFLEEADLTDVSIDDPALADVRAALDEAFTESDPRTVAARNESIRAYWLGIEETSRGRRPIAIALSIGIWWIACFIAVTIVVRTMQLFTFLARRRRQRRAYAKLDAGACVVCGYNLTGLEFRSHCPECGALTGVTDPIVARRRGVGPESSR